MEEGTSPRLREGRPESTLWEEGCGPWVNRQASSSPSFYEHISCSC